jgi:hypothetical protein
MSRGLNEDKAVDLIIEGLLSWLASLGIESGVASIVPLPASSPPASSDAARHGRRLVVSRSGRCAADVRRDRCRARQSLG